MPREHFDQNFKFLPREQILSFEELARLARVFARFSVRTFRLTGGEPLLRRNIEHLIRLLSSIEGAEVALTTNGSLLKAKAADLQAAGLDRLTVSLDALDDETFAQLNDVDFPVSEVLDGIEAATSAGFHPIKINAVIRRGYNEHSVLDLLNYFKPRGHIVRFIEYMDVGQTNAWQPRDVVTKHEILELIQRQLPLESFPLETVELARSRGVAEVYRFKDGRGQLGVIPSVTRPFCRSCDRARLSADGKLYTCLFSGVGFDLKQMLRAGATDDELHAAIRQRWQARDDRYSELRAQRKVLLPRAEMSYLGG